MRVAFIGPPGSGKGTYSQMLAKKGWVHFSIGQVFREHVKANGKYAKIIAARQKAGTLVPTTAFFAVFDEFMRKHGEKKIIFDGLPRNVVQAKAMEKILAKRKTPMSAFIYLDVPEAELHRRLGARRTCQTCGTVYGATLQPKKKGICDKDGGTLVQRNDDNPAGIQTRLRVYKEETLPTLEYASARFPVFYVHGEGSPAVVFKRIARVISLVEKGK